VALGLLAFGVWPLKASSQEGRLEAVEFPGSLIGMQYETWFTPLNAGTYETAEAIPILGKYSSFDVKTLRTHAAWFTYLGVDWLLLDWSNMLWATPAWEEHKGATRELEDATELLFKTYAQLEKEGKHPPKLVIMVGLQNGPLVPNAIKRLNGILAWTQKRFLDNPAYRNLWLYYHGKPLLTILNTPPLTCDGFADQTRGLAASAWTVRYMGSQLQDSHAEKCGFWSWMDGPIRQVVTRNGDAAEETVVAAASFPFAFVESQMPNRKGWLDPQAAGHRHGSSYIESWKVAFESRPKFIQIHQWNEFAGQKVGGGFGPDHDIFGDEYDQELSDDIEPTQINACGIRGCGGWGYYYMNLTKALISLYRKETPDITVMALAGPFQPAVIQKPELRLHWTTVGKTPANYTLQVDGKPVARQITGEDYVLHLANIVPGKHRITLVANGAHTYFDLTPERMARKSDKPLPVTSSIEFTYTPPAH
jgi:hypothetical protein